MTRLSPIERFRVRYRIDESGCWVWISLKNWKGYPLMTVNNRTVAAQRWGYEYHVGQIPEGFHLHHICRNRACVNPEHLEPIPSRQHVRMHRAEHPRGKCSIDGCDKPAHSLGLCHGHWIPIYRARRKEASCKAEGVPKQLKVTPLEARR